MPVELLRTLRLREVGFGLDTEITASLLRLGTRPYELPIRYVGRSKAEGKKIGYPDALRCMYLLAKLRVARPDRLRRRPAPMAARRSSGALATI